MSYNKNITIEDFIPHQITSSTYITNKWFRLLNMKILECKDLHCCDLFSRDKGYKRYTCTLYKNSNLSWHLIFHNKDINDEKENISELFRINKKIYIGILLDNSRNDLPEFAIYKMINRYKRAYGSLNALSKEDKNDIINYFISNGLKDRIDILTHGEGL